MNDKSNLFNILNSSLLIHSVSHKDSHLDLRFKSIRVVKISNFNELEHYELNVRFILTKSVRSVP